MVELDTIYNENCLTGMQRIPDGTVDAIICDLPYGVLNRESEGGSWDSAIPFEPLWEQYLRITKSTSPIVLFAQGMFTADLMQSNRKMWRYNLVWNKVRTVGFLNANRMPLRSHEDICVFYRKLGTFNPQMEALNGRDYNHRRGNSRQDEKNSCYGKFSRINTTSIGEKYPRSIIVQPAVHCGENQFHPTQKPLDLMRYLVLTYTNPGAIVLDNACGSGTTCLAAALEGRRYIGFETNKKYCDMAVLRIKEQTRQQKIFCNQK